MQKTATIILAILLAAAVIFGVVHYRRAGDAQTSLKTCRQQTDRLQTRAENLTAQLEGLEQQSAEGARNRKRLQTRLESLAGRLERLKQKSAEDARQLARLNDLENTLKIRQRELAACRGKRQDAEKMLQDCKGRESAARQQNAALTENLEQLRAGSSELREEKAALTESLERLRAERSNLQKEYAEVRTAKGMAEAQLGKLKTAYDSLRAELKDQLASREASLKEKDKHLALTFVESILFDFAKAELKPEGRVVLRKVGNVLRKMGEGTVRVEGHTDNVPIARVYRHRYPSNWELSSARAAVVVRFLHKETGVDPARLEAVGLAYYRPVASNASAKGRARNRRVEIIISPRLPVAGRSNQD